MSTADKLRQQGREEGFAEGKAQGEAEGEAKGQVAGRAALLLKQLTLKFGKVSATTKRRVTRATIEQLDAFAARVLSAQAPDEVFETGPIGRPRAVQPRRSTSKTRKKR
jgi:flagellar biosynthesis/type III secretory pathway protein FliH